jgi:hypothetical protein
MAPKTQNRPGADVASARTNILSWAFVVERVRRIELALSAWEVQRQWPLAALSSQFRCLLVAVAVPLLTLANGPLMARRSPNYLP